MPRTQFALLSSLWAIASSSARGVRPYLTWCPLVISIEHGPVELGDSRLYPKTWHPFALSSDPRRSARCMRVSKDHDFPIIQGRGQQRVPLRRSGLLSRHC